MNGTILQLKNQFGENIPVENINQEIHPNQIAFHELEAFLPQNSISFTNIDCYQFSINPHWIFRLRYRLCIISFYFGCAALASWLGFYNLNEYKASFKNIVASYCLFIVLSLAIGLKLTGLIRYWCGWDLDSEGVKAVYHRDLVDALPTEHERTVLKTFSPALIDINNYNKAVTIFGAKLKLQKELGHNQFVPTFILEHLFQVRDKLIRSLKVQKVLLDNPILSAGIDPDLLIHEGAQSSIDQSIGLATEWSEVFNVMYATNTRMETSRKIL